uniref:Sepiapterin reductase n=1 Tax=Amphiprion ocellaris TaxID=80972 RepID=A0AAQ5ZT03_AMPOC
MSSAHSAHLGRVLCIITGASRGFGRTVAREVSGLVKPGSVLVLAARSGDDLRSLQAELTESEAGRAGLRVESVVADMAQMEGIEKVVRSSEEAFSEHIDHLILVNNAGAVNFPFLRLVTQMNLSSAAKVSLGLPFLGWSSPSLGDVSRSVKTFTDMAEVDSYLSLNVSSSMCLTARVLQSFPQRPGLRRTIVNVTSLCALQPFRSWVLYCTGKAAREMMFRVLAEEEPDLRVLNYSPGPLDTAMQVEARTRTADDSIRKSFVDMFDQGQLLTCEASCAKLMKLLLEDNYTSGAHIDVYDV